VCRGWTQQRDVEHAVGKGANALDEVVVVLIIVGVAIAVAVCVHDGKVDVGIPRQGVRSARLMLTAFSSSALHLIGDEKSL
jgi:hypothetical protein